MSNLHLVNKDNGGKPGRSFYVALGLCLAAVAVAGWTTYDSMVHYADNTASAAQNAANTVSGVMVSSTSALVPEVPSEAETSSVASEEETVSIVPAEAAVTQLNKPIQGDIITAFSESPVYYESLGDWRAHTGIDIAADEGVSVGAAADGSVSAVEDDPLYGTVVTVSHQGGMTTIYAGLSGASVKQGNQVKAGQELGRLGAVPAEAEEETHLHFEVQKDGTFVDPQTLFS
ncbi:M23 family metallopeptidase [Caproicibacterium sp. BJN0003]|uniref:M23 family metallopeptidase n=1 Tax=Caproicibacterium sp. BJN0003 TaxID=2994078 RepID=UPI002258BDF0|nr:M23 family metallopeptidase [Caproicibacterium sp. BJN0003]UZT82963.1 M23 family metallopeptidase [Caproicibacterium sp. BJN0003]